MIRDCWDGKCFGMVCYEMRRRGLLRNFMMRSRSRGLIGVICKGFVIDFKRQRGSFMGGCLFTF